MGSREPDDSWKSSVHSASSGGNAHAEGTEATPDARTPKVGVAQRIDELDR